MKTQHHFPSAIPYILATSSLAMLFALTGYAQTPGNVEPSIQSGGRIVYSSTALFRPGTSLLAEIDSPTLRDKPGSGESVWSLQLAVLEKLEFEVTNEGYIAKADGDMQTSPLWGMKFRILQSESKSATFSAIVRSSLGTEYTQTWAGSINSITDNILDKGLQRYRYDNRFISAGLLLSYALDENIAFHGGLEAGQISVYNAELDLVTSAAGKIQRSVQSFNRSVDLQAFAGLSVHPSQRFDINGELQTLPELAPSHDESTIEVYRALRTAVELKYAVTKSTSVTVKASHVFLPIGVGVSEVRLGIDALASLE